MPFNSREWLSKHPEQSKIAFLKYESKTNAIRILNIKYVELSNISIRQVLADNAHFGLYVGFTKQKLEEEDLRWITERGANTKAGKTMINAIDLLSNIWTISSSQYGFKSIVAYESACMTNACAVEDAMHKSKNLILYNME